MKSCVAVHTTHLYHRVFDLVVPEEPHREEDVGKNVEREERQSHHDDVREGSHEDSKTSSADAYALLLLPPTSFCPEAHTKHKVP